MFCAWLCHSCIGDTVKTYMGGIRHFYLLQGTDKPTHWKATPRLSQSSKPNNAPDREAMTASCRSHSTCSK